MALISWILISAVTGFLLGFFIEWKILQTKLEVCGEEWGNRNNRLELSKAKLKKDKKRLEIHLLASHKKTSILESKYQQLEKTSKAHGIQYKDIISELMSNKRKLQLKFDALGVENDGLKHEADLIRERITDTRNLEKNNTQVLEDLALFKEDKREEINAIRGETQQIITEKELEVNKLQTSLKELEKLKVTNSDLVVDLNAEKQSLNNELQATDKQYRRLLEEYEEYKKEVLDNEDQAKLMLQQAKSKLSYLETKLSTVKKSTESDKTTKKDLNTGRIPRQKPALRILKDHSKDLDTTHDDLKKIKGIGPQLEKRLNVYGISRFEQLARLDKNEITSIDSELGFKGRIVRDDWISQAQDLSNQLE